MPHVFAPDDVQPCDLEECTDALDAAGFDPRDPDSLNDAAHWLRRLGSNPDFLGDLLIAELAQHHRDDVLGSNYGPQVIMLRPPGGDYFIRANLWPAAGDHMLRASGGDAFVYGLAHDHNFDFLTYGYFGPGYWSDYYEYDYAEVAGARGEHVPSLRFVERARLEPGKLMHYRAHRDVHAQLPADALSVSLNLVHVGGAQPWLDQYAFDLPRGQIARILSAGASEAFLQIAVALSDDEALDLAHHFARRHPSDRMRLCAWQALAEASADPDAVWREAERSGSRLVAIAGRARRAMFAA